MDITQISEREQLELLGRTLSSSAFMDVLERYTYDGCQQWKISPILAGLPQEVFSEALMNASPAQLEAFKHESATEPFQYQLILTCSEFGRRMEELDKMTASIENEIRQLDTTNIGREDLKPILKEIDKLAKAHEDLLAKIDRALSLAWNTERKELINRLGVAKEHCHRLLTTAVGHAMPQTGLYAILQTHLNKIYTDVDQESQVLQDEDPAIEALVRFAVWDLNDYALIGLLPEISNLELLKLGAEHSEQERLEQHRKILQIVRRHLKEYGLATVKDLKQAGIFSKKSLREYLSSS